MVPAVPAPRTTRRFMADLPCSVGSSHGRSPGKYPLGYIVPASSGPRALVGACPGSVPGVSGPAVATPPPAAVASDARDLRSLPKAHLHLHFTGAMRHLTLLELAERHGIRLPDALRSETPPELRATDERGWFR